jgi:hypothetical protein
MIAGFGLRLSTARMKSGSAKSVKRFGKLFSTFFEGTFGRRRRWYSIFVCFV